MKKENVLFRFVPTMRCNFRCNYCFLSNDQKGTEQTMFDYHGVNEWVEAMKLFSDKNVEFYMWGGEPFVLDQTYELLREWTKMDHIISGCRIDTNLFFADKIAELCPSEKIKLNCSYHMQYHTLDEQYRKIKLLNDLNMVGMMNFVASEYNVNKLKNEYKMTIDDLIEKFGEIGVFVNVAGDFNIANNPAHPKHDEYKELILKYVSPEEWKFLRSEVESVQCNAGKSFFTVHHTGRITSCIDCDKKVYGDFIKGELFPDIDTKECSVQCPSLISYPFREDNDFVPVAHLCEYVNRVKNYRENIRL